MATMNNNENIRDEQLDKDTHNILKALPADTTREG